MDENKNPDLTPLYGASTTVGKVISKGDVVVYESTVYPGVTEDEYNRAYHQDVRLQDDEVLVTSNFFEFGKTFDIDNTKYQIKDVIHQPYLLPNENSTAEKNIIVIMKDEAAIQKMMSSFFGDEIQPTENLSIKYSDQSKEKEAEDILERCLEKFTIQCFWTGTW